MNYDKRKLPAGLYFVATPIGNARDITLRGLDILASADVLAAEDTRSLRRLMEIHGIPLGDRPLISYHDHNGDRARPRLLAALAEGQSVAYASEAGTPLIADPGFDLSRVAAAEGHLVTSAPGPSAVATALTIAGLPTDRFLFAGFLPNTQSARRKALAELGQTKATLVFYESPKRLAAMLADAAESIGPDRNAAVCRELTKKFEEVRHGTLAELADQYADATVKGEIVVLIDRGSSTNISETDVTQALEEALVSMSVRDAADFVAKMFNLPRRPIYQQAMKMGKG
ncbi:16S rRNA (cytidine(1402)-2'-O)-methyltransferase [Pseudoprimorskyibacter insulae]|uniref:Ribosomal RNA small subunit methyltransferase I n=1 Tax=Pseudoprimorskyibacter insulae TaxID=1695997 RepID=A0A2R8AP26_9RHOB|nr:16S rRNA (cytidine(1402)-2'-O)-methyltransferase [Pseudoprimorskyibacter insulae]SPF77619.1 Ribosomal RNA small subunit methyltransferase I [Pseudoprimorskyibacter insulae]